MQTTSLEHESRRGAGAAAPQNGAIVGFALAAVVLVWVAFALITAEGNTAKVLVAVWLWALPVLGIGGGAGWLLGRLGQRIGGR